MPQKTVSIVIEVAGADDAIQRVRQMRSALDDLGRGGAESMIPLRRQSREVTQAMKEMEKTFRLRQLQKEMVGDLEDFFGRIISGAWTTGDLFKNIWRGIADFFKRTVREIAAAGTLGLGGLFPLLSSLSAGSSGLGRLGRPGALGTLVGSAVAGGFGVGGGAGAAAVSRGATTAATLGLPPTTPPGDVLARLGLGAGLRGAAPALGALAGVGLIGSGNRAASILGGFFGGGFAGLATGLAFGGPIGALVGGLLGGIFGGGGKKKEHDAAIANQGFAQLRQILEDFQRFRRDFASSIDAAHQVWNQMAAQFVRKESAPSQRPFFDQIIEAIRRTEDERNRRRQLLGMLSVPEFAEGGLVTSRSFAALRMTSGGGTLALLHPGEFVMNRQAVDRLGTSVLEGLNSGPLAHGRGSDTTVTLEIPSQEFFNQVVERSIPVILRRGGTASKVLRG